MPNTNYKSLVGVDKIYYALVTQDDANAYAAGTPAIFAPAMTIMQTPKTNSKVQYADNQPFDAMFSEGESELEVEIPGLPLDLQATLTGRVFDAVNGRLFDNGGVPPYVALGFRALKSDGKYRYFWFLKGQFSPPNEESASQSDAPDPKPAKLKFTAVRTIKTFALTGSITDSVKRVVGDTSDTLFVATTWFDSVQVPVQGSPAAFTATPSPADGAVGQSTTVPITITFSNPLAGGAENGIGLLRSSTDAAVAVTRTINAARTVVTLAHPTLAATAKYLITLNGVMSIYTQTLVDTVYDFTTT